MNSLAGCESASSRPVFGHAQFTNDDKIEKVNALIQENKSALFLGFEKLSQKIRPSLSDLFIRVGQEPGSYVNCEKSLIFPTHYDIRLVVEDRQIRLLSKLDKDGMVSHLYIYLMKGWNADIDKGSQKNVRLACRISTRKKKSTLIASAKTSELNLSTDNELDCHKRLKGIDGVAKTYLFFTIYNSKTHCSQQLQMMKYYPNIALDLYRMQEEINIEKKIQIIIRLFEILLAVHNKGVSHNDLKPSNILLDENCLPFLTDFGHASIGKYCLEGMRGGTIGYYPSEVCSAQLSRKFRKKERKVCSVRWILLKKRNQLENPVYDKKKLSDEIRELNGNLFKFSVELEKVTDQVNILCPLNSHRVNKIYTKKNDICALGFIVEDLFGIGEFPEIDELVTQMTDDLPRRRLSLENGLEIMRKFQSSQVPQTTSAQQ